MRFWIRKKAFGVTESAFFRGSFLFLLLLPFEGFSGHTLTGDVFEDFEPQDISITPGGKLVIQSGATIDVQSGSTINGVWDFGSATSIAIPSSAAPTTDATAEIALDTSITGHKPLIQYYSGAQNMTVVALPTLNLDTTNGDVIKYDATAQEFKMQPDDTGGGGGGSTDLEGAYHTDTVGDAQITIDARDISLNLADSTSDFRVSIDNTTTGEVTTAFEVVTSGSGATIVNALDLSDPDITNALSIGENRIIGTYFNWDGGGQLAIGNNGTGIVTLQGGGGIDTTSNGDLKLAPHGTGIIDIPTGITFRLPQASPTENKNGLYWDAANNKLCIDKDSDLCTSALDGAAAAGLDASYDNGPFITVDAADVDFNLANFTNDYKFSIDNTSGGEISTAMEITTSSTGSTFVTALDLSDPDITNALSIGENRIIGTYFNWDGGGQLAIGNNGTGIVTLQGGGGIDTTSNGDLKLAPHGTGIIDIPTGITFRLPQASPTENKNGLYWDAANNKLCIDKDSDLCTSALDGAAAAGLDASYDNGPFITVDAADVDFNLANFTNDYKFSIDNTSGGEISTAMEITTSSTGSTFVTALDLSDPDITNALSIGENRIIGTYFNWDGGGQLAIGNNGTGIVTLQGGGGIDTTSNGDLKLAPHGTGIIDIPTGITFRLPQASPKENKNGLYWDAANNKLCIDKNPDVCVTLALLNLDNEQLKILSDFLSHKEGIEKLTRIISDRERIEKIAFISNIEFTPAPFTSPAAQPDQPDQIEEKKKLATIERISKGETWTTGRPFDRGSAGLVNGEIFVELHPKFLKTIAGSSQIPEYYVQITPTSTDVKGPLVVLKGDAGFRVIDIGGKTNATFDWEASAHLQEN